MRDVVIFGGAGFIGRHIARGLDQRRDVRIVVADFEPPCWALPDSARFVLCDVRSLSGEFV